MEGMVKSATQTLREKYIPKEGVNVFVPAEEYRGIYEMLEVWGKNTEDPDNQEKAKFVYETLKSQGNPKDSLIHIFTELGETPVGDTKLNRVHRYLKLRNESKKILNHFESIQTEINALRKP